MDEARSNQSAFGTAIHHHFLLEEGVAFLNHGSFGACPRPVLEAAEAWRRRLEAEPVRFMARELPKLLRAAADRLARFVGARGDDLAFVDNATSGMNAVIRSLSFAPADEILSTSHVYNAVRTTLAYAAVRSGARVVEQPVPFPVAGEDEIVAAVEAGISARTKLLVIDHITSPTALIFPVARLIERAHARGIRVLVDGAHAPGQLPLDLETLGADYYVGNCHKWLFAPKGCGFLWARRDAQAALHPTVISHGYEHGYLAEFDWTGTRDPAPALAVTAALEFIEGLGVEAMRAHNHALACEAAQLLSQTWQQPVGGPPALLGSMATIGLPLADPATQEQASAINARLLDEHRIEVPVFPFAGRLWLRISAQIYNTLDDYKRLAAVAW
jgi:isopenicillin-N epimerase